MKNKISGFIVDSAERIQELSHDLADAFRNNFVAIIIFLMTVLLTDSIDFTQFFGREVSPKVTAVCAIFTIATLLYFVATILMGNQKWSWLKQSYDDLKKNYNGVFDSKDIEESFNNDEPLNHAEKQYKGIRMQIGAIWIVLIVAMALFTGVLMWQGYNIFSQQISINEVESISTEENAIDVQINSTTSAME